MATPASILRRIPLAVQPKQALFIDGIRYASDIIEVGYARLRQSLTEIALAPPDSDQLAALSPAVFLDAWAVVDAVDRFRMLYQQMPGIRSSEPELGKQTLAEVAAPFRDLRNVADHLAQRADFVVARGGAALGALSWVTCFQVKPAIVWFCVLRPGTIRVQPEFRKEPLVTVLDWPTDRICLAAGGFEANLSAIRPHIKRRIEHFQDQLEREFNRLGIADTPAASDVFMRQAYQMAPGQFPWQDDDA